MAQAAEAEKRSISWLKTPDIPFSRDDANRFLPWIIAFMVCLTGLMLSAALSLNTALHSWNGAYLNSFTLQVPMIGEEHSVTSDEVIELLRGNEWVDGAREITQEEMQGLIEPWLGQSEALSKLPLPLLIEVKVKDGHNVDVPALQHRLEQLVPGAQIDDYELWMAKFERFSRTVQWIATALAVCMIATTLGIVILAAKTALRLHQQTVEVLYTIGAQDSYIAEQFQSNAMWLVFKGAAAGTGIAAAIFWLFSRLTGAFDSPLLPAIEFSLGHGLLFVTLPLLTAAAALFSTRFAVLALLKQKP